MLLQLFAPAISSALAATAGALALEICSAHGQPAGSDDASDTDARADAACLYCTHHLQSAGGSPARPTLASGLGVVGRHIPRRTPGPRVAPPWSPGQPRAPPERAAPRA